MKKVIVIGIDGATWDLVKPWCEKDELPTFKKLMRKGTWGELESTIPPMTGPAWVSFATGKNPGKHGFYNFLIRTPGEYKTKLLNAKDIKCKTLWEILSIAKKKIAVLNVPVTYPLRKINGVMISGMLTPSINSNFTYPPQFKQEIFNLIPDYKIAVKIQYSDNPLQRETFLKEIISTLDKRVKLFKYLFNTKKWGFLMVHFIATDTIQHSFWKFIDKNHPLYKDESDQQYKNAILNIYKKVDEFLNWLLENIDNNTTIILMSDHGFGPLYKNLYLNNWLRSKGYLSYKRNPARIIRTGITKSGFSPGTLFRFMIKMGFGKLTPFISRDMKMKLINKVIKKFVLSFSDINWSKTKAFYIGSGSGYGFIYINLKGREFKGVVQKDEYEEIRDALINDLNELTYPDSNEKIIGNLWKREELFNGPYFEIAPDIVFRAKDSSLGTSINFEFNSLRIIDKPITGTSGTHRINGIFLIYGNNIKENFNIKNAKIYDIMPTILHIFKIPISKDVDGRVLNEAFQD